MKKSKATIAAAFLTAGMALTAIPAHATEAPIQSISQQKSSIQSVEEVRASFAASAKDSVFGRESLEKFSALSPELQEKVSRIILDPVKTDLIFDEFISSSGAALSKAAESRLSQKSTVTSPLFDGLVTFESSNVVVTPTTSSRSLLADPTATQMIKYAFKLAGVTVTEVQVQMTVSYNSTRITAVLGCTPGYSNTYPGRSVTMGVASKWLSGNNGVCQTGYQVHAGTIAGIVLGTKSVVHTVTFGPWGIVSNVLS